MLSWHARPSIRILQAHVTSVFLAGWMAETAEVCHYQYRYFSILFSTPQTVYNDDFWLLLTEPRWCSAASLFLFHNVSAFDTLIYKLTCALWQSSRNSFKSLVHKLFASDIYFQSNLCKHLQKLLYQVCMFL